MRKRICFSLLSLNLLSTACQPGPANPIPSSGLNRILTITSETQDPKLPKILVPGLELKVFAGSGAAGYKNGPKLDAEFKSIGGIAQDDEGNLYVSDYQDLRIRKIDNHGQVSTLAGTGEKVLNGKMGSFAENQFYSAGALLYQPPHQLYVSDFEADRLFRLNLDTQSSELFMIEPQYTPPERLPTLDTSVLPIVFSRPSSLAVYKGDLYLNTGFEIWKLIQSNQRYHLERYAGNEDVRNGSIDDAQRNFKDGPPDDSKFNGIIGLAFDRDGNLYVSDSQNQRIRKVAAGTREVSTFSNQDIPISNRSIDKVFVGGFQDGRLNEAQFESPGPLALTEAGDMFVLDANEGGALRWISQGHVKTLFQNCLCTLLKDGRKTILYVASYKNRQIYTLDLSQLEKLKPQILKQEIKP
ncbi:MAG: hypothetical protein AB7I41_24310 [Candidatus Sericytochromatia bacterium]